ncbi:uncharacterized protein LOC8076742 isoform X4 [Sorghum bicolor]|uniref:uncharacterized protein LOC8076742 isoform X4 n=1 Tax=Sorghum bicolor TaxID=4558 RepID=UPI000B4269DA|nr:uncharacterized protein LOC8076742 isoform X4 [Sorghum bicolor]|eukprot:XP_021304204.1 uncharacterized protein LOC8076742 isoform X4 [Sorghum bicolor]
MQSSCSREHRHRGGLAIALSLWVAMEAQRKKGQTGMSASHWQHGPAPLLVLSCAHVLCSDAVASCVCLDFGALHSLLINGRGQFNCSLAAAHTPGANQCAAAAVNTQCAPVVFPVQPNKTYRLRVASTTSLASLNLAVGNHKLTVVEADGNYVDPFVVDDVDLYSGDSYSVLLTTDQDTSSNYWVSVGRRATGHPGVGRLRPQQGVHVQDPRARRDGPAAGDGGPPHRAAQHAEQDGRAHQVVHQQRVHGAPGHAVPGVAEDGAQVHAGGGAPGGDVQPGLRREAAAAEPEHDGRGQRVRAGAQHHRGRGAPERQRAVAERQRGAPVAPPRPRLLGAGLRRRRVPRRRRRRGAAQPQGPAAAEHGGDLPVRVDDAPVRGGQPGGVGVPLPHRAAPPHGHGRHLRRGGGPRRQGAQRGRVLRRHGHRTHGRRPRVIAIKCWRLGKQLPAYRACMHVPLSVRSLVVNYYSSVMLYISFIFFSY